MSSVVTHSIVHALQLAVSISIVTTAAFLLHYRIQNHSNFSSEPLSSCISGAVAFIYAFWAILNRHSQPENHRWIYLHGFCCFIVGGLLLACSIVAFVYSSKGYPCRSFADDQDAASSSTVGELGLLGGLSNSQVVILVHYPPYDSGEHYGPGDLCENTYEDLDKACAVMGVIGFILWACDFCLIFGWFGSSGQYDSYRNRRHFRRGQVHPDDTSDHYRNDRDGLANFELDENYHDTLDRRKRGVSWLKQGTGHEPTRHDQGPISVAAQPTFFDGPLTADAAAARPANVLPDQFRSDMQRPPAQDQVTAPERICNAQTASYGVDHSRDDAVYHSTMRLEATAQTPSSHPHSPPMGEQSPDPLTLLNETMQEHSEQAQHNIIQEHQPTYTSQPIPPTLTIRSAALPQPSQNVESDRKAYIPNSEEDMSFTCSSPCHDDVSPGPACYAFDSSHSEYLPSFVNMAARLEQKQYRKDSLKSNTVSRSGTPHAPSPSPHISEPASPFTTGLGSDVVPQADGEATPNWPRDQEISATATSGMPAIAHSAEPSKSSASSSSVDQAPQSPTGQAKQSPVQAQMSRKPSKIKRRTSKLSVMTLKSGPRSVSASGNGPSTGSAGPSSLGIPKSEATEDSPQMSPRSPYVGDF